VGVRSPFLLLQHRASADPMNCPFMPFKVVYSADQILIDFTLIVIALRRLVAAILWLFLNTVGYLLALYPVVVYWE